MLMTGMCYIQTLEITKKITNNAFIAIPIKETLGINELVFISDSWSYL